MLNNSLRNKSLIFVILIFGIVACRAPKTIIHKSEIKNITPTVLYDSLKCNYGNIKAYNGKFKAVIEQDKKSNTVYGSIKIKTDSIVWVSINPGMGIEIARAQFLKDSMYVLERINSQYYKGSYIYLKKILDIDLEYNTLQSLLLNSLIFLGSENDTNTVLKNSIIKKEKSGKFIQIENFQKRYVKRIDSDDQLPPVYERIRIDNRNLKISEILIKDFKDQSQIEIDYLDFEFNEGINVDFPKTINIKIKKGNKTITICLMFSKQEFNNLNSFQFSIPNSYKPFQFNTVIKNE